MADPLTALMYAVQVMNSLKMLILQMLKEREEPILGAASVCHSGPSDENGHHSPKFHLEACKEEENEQTFVQEEPTLDSPAHETEDISTRDHASDTSQTSQEVTLSAAGPATVQANPRRKKKVQPRSLKTKKGARRANAQSVRSTASDEKSRGISIVSHINPRLERVEAWR